MSRSLHRNAHALVLSTLITSGLGVVFWLIAARNYSEAEVGLNSALVAAMLLIASVANLGLKNSLVRFVPDGGADAAALIKGAYGLATLVAGVAALILVLGLRSLVPELADVGPASTVAVWFTAATMAWVVFQLQDSVLTGLRRATWVLAENTAFSVIKIGLLLIMASVGTRLGIFASWTLPLTLFVVVVNALIFRRLITSSEPRTSVRTVRARDVAHLAGADFLGSLFWDAALLGLPLVVLSTAGAEANAHYYLAWSTAYVLYVVVSNIGQSFVVEAVRERHRIGELTRRALALSAGLVGMFAAGLVVVAPGLLRVFGDSYSEQGSTALRLMAVSAVPYTLTGIYLSLARVERRIKSILAVYVALSTSVLALSLVWLGPFGISGVGMAWLVSQTAVAGFLLVKGFRKFWLPLLGIPVPHFLLVWRRSRRERASSSEVRQLANLIAISNQQAEWIRTSHDVVIAAIGPHDGHASEVVRVSRSERAERSIEANAKALRALAADPRLGSWSNLAPKVLSTSSADGDLYTVESHMAGVPASELLIAGSPADDFQSNAGRVISDLHRLSMSSIRVDSTQLAIWLNEPVEAVAKVVGEEGRVQLRHVQQKIKDAFNGNIVRAGWVHGDFTQGNVLLSPDGRVSGIVDWGLSSPLHLPEIDLWLLSLSTRRFTEERELGEIVVELLKGDSWPAQVHPNDDLPWQPLLLTCWLHHVAGNLTKSETYARNRIWLSRNVEAVLMAAASPAVREPIVDPGAPGC